MNPDGQLRVLITTTGYPGHVLPLVPFARAWVRAGHDVWVAGPRSGEPIAKRMGLQYQACTGPREEEVARIVASVAELTPEEGHARMIEEGFGRLGTSALLPDLVQAVGIWRPDVVVRESHEFAGSLAAERHGVPHVRVGLGLASTEDETLSHAAGAVDEVRAELGLPADPRAEQMRGSPYMTLVPGSLERPAAPGPAATHRFQEARRSPAALPDWWPGNDGPLVYVTFGSVAGSLGFFPGLYRAAAEALADVPVRVLVTTGERADPAALGSLPPNVHVERWVAHEGVLHDAAAVVCHGGYGSVLGALAHGLPLVMMPLFAGDQWHNARRVSEVGAGIALFDRANGERRMFDPPAADIVAALPGVVRQVLDDPGYRRAAGRLAEEVAALPTVDSSVNLLGS